MVPPVLVCEVGGCGARMRAAAVFLSFWLAATSVTGDGCLVKLSAHTFGQEGRNRMR